MPKAQSKEQLDACDIVRITEIAVVNPGIAIIPKSSEIVVVLARHVLTQIDLTQMQRARVIRLPLGWRRNVLLLLSRFWRVCLPDEFEYEDVEIRTMDGSSSARADGHWLCVVENPGLVLPLTGPDYFKLMAMRGRDLHQGSPKSSESAMKWESQMSLCDS